MPALLFVNHAIRVRHYIRVVENPCRCPERNAMLPTIAAVLLLVTKTVGWLDDTDVGRNTEALLNSIFDGLRWLGLGWDEEYLPERAPGVAPGLQR